MHRNADLLKQHAYQFLATNKRLTEKITENLEAKRKAVEDMERNIRSDVVRRNK
jgi:hypothetical protein